MLVLGWWLVPISLFRLVPLSIDALSWRQLLPASSRPGVFGVVWMRFWMGKSDNALLPVAGVGGDIAGARLVHQRGVPGEKAAAAMVVDVTVGRATQLILVMARVTLLAARSSAGGGDPGGVGDADRRSGVRRRDHVIRAGPAQRRVCRVRQAGAPRGACKKWPFDLTGSASAVDDAVVAIYRRGFPVLRASLLRLAGWAASAGEIWLIMHFLSRPFSVTDAFCSKASAPASKGGVPGARSAGRPRGRLCCVWRAVRTAGRHCAGHSPRQTGSRIGPGAARPHGLAVGRRATSHRRGDDRANSTPR